MRKLYYCPLLILNFIFVCNLSAGSLEDAIGKIANESISRGMNGPFYGTAAADEKTFFVTGWWQHPLELDQNFSTPTTQCGEWAYYVAEYKTTENSKYYNEQISCSDAPNRKPAADCNRWLESIEAEASRESRSSYGACMAQVPPLTLNCEICPTENQPCMPSAIRSSIWADTSLVSCAVDRIVPVPGNSGLCNVRIRMGWKQWFLCARYGSCAECAEQ